jgi:uncharacterized protein (DUF2126 family)
MSVKRIREAPRITRPFSDESWARLDSSASRSTPISARDVRLTMGGEPTFVSVDDLEAPEWNIAAVGPTKRALADDLIRKLRARFAPAAAALRAGQMVSGESLPRWAFGLYWRKDGVPIWKNADLIARIENPRKAEIATPSACWRHREAARLDPAMCMPAYEDPRTGCRRKPRFRSMSILDPNCPIRRALADGAGVRRASTSPGFCAADAALERRRRPAHWRSAGTPARHLFLIPAIPAWLRLPMARSEHPPEEYPYIVEQDPMEPRDDAIRQAQGRKRRRRKRKPNSTRAHGDVDRNPRRHLCAFMPPVEKVDDYLELDTAVEATAEEIADPGHVEGYRRRSIRASRSSGDARPWRDRGQHPAGAELARGGRHHLRPV